MAFAPGHICRVFTQRTERALAEQGVEVGVIVLDDNRHKSEHPFRHALEVARRQARVAGCSTARGLAKKGVYEVVTGLTAPDVEPPPFPAGAPIHRVSSLNSEACIEAVRRAGCDLVCLMGARILSKETLRALALPIINIHSSDPRFVRGGPPVFWEILYDHPDTMLTIHEVTDVLDAGAILEQAPQPILYGGGLGRTIEATMEAARPRIADLFQKTVLAYRHDAVRREEFEPGPVRVTPTLGETLRAEWLCRRRSRDRLNRDADG